MLFAVVYVLVVIAAFFFQELLIFHPQPLPREDYLSFELENHAKEEISVETEDGIRLRGWFLKNIHQEKAPTLIYFGGNAEEVSGQISEMTRLRNVHVVLVNYRGYGRSEGRPGEDELLSDSLAVYDKVIQRQDVDEEKIIVKGRSLGTAVATYLAAHRQVHAAVLVSPFDSLVNVARRQYFFLPVNLLMRHRFEVGNLAPVIHEPMLALVAEHDSVVTPETSERMAGKWAGPTTVKLIEGKDHNSIVLSPEYWSAIENFLDEQLAGNDRNDSGDN